MPKKIPLKGKPDFTNVSDARLNDYIDFVQQMIFTYKGVDEAKVSVLRDIWKEMTVEHSERVKEDAFAELDKQEAVKNAPLTVHRIKPIPKLKRKNI